MSFSLSGDIMTKGELVELRNPQQDEVGLRFILLEDPDSGRVLAEAVVDMAIRPSYILRVDEIKVVSSKEPTITNR